MTHPKPPGQGPERGGFAQARAAAARAEVAQRVQAARTVAGNSLDAQDRRTLLSMLDLPDPAQDDDLPAPDDETYLLAQALDEYVRAVADAVGVPHEGTTCEVTDTITAYLGLARRRPEHPDRDLMLIWSEWQGWVVAVETNPTEPPVTLSCFGSDTVPPPAAVARFVTESLARRRPGPLMVALPAAADRRQLAERMNRRTGQH